jgi:DNA polymerase I
MNVVCLCAKELHSSRKVKMWSDELKTHSAAPFRLDKKVCFVAYMASAEWGSFLSLGWELPKTTIDFYCVFKNITNGKLGVPQKKGLLNCLKHYGIASIETAHKNAMRDRILEGEPFKAEEKKSIIDYCDSDVESLEKLVPKLEPYIFQTENHYGRYWIMGEYTKATAHVERVGIPIDTEWYALFQKYKERVVSSLIEEVNADYEVYENGVFKLKKLENYLKKHNIPWDRTPSGLLKTDGTTFRDMAKVHPQLNPLREVRNFKSLVSQSPVSIGKDGRNRAVLFPLSTITGRNSPKASKSIISGPSFSRFFIKPERGLALIYLDWASQEYGIAAVLSRDEKMIAAYESGDPYLSFGKDAGLIPKEATKKTHAKEREVLKPAVLAMNYGMGSDALAVRIDKTPSYAADLIKKFSQTYSRYWNWNQAVIDRARLYGDLWTRYGWELHDGQHQKVNTLRNWIMQSNGADMLRLATIFMAEAGISINMLIHDGILIESPIEDIEATSKIAQGCMKEASEYVLNGFALRTDEKITKYPERFTDERGREFWEKLNIKIDEQIALNEK